MGQSHIFTSWRLNRPAMFLLVCAWLTLSLVLSFEDIEKIEVGRIVHGQEAEDGSLPYQVSLQLNFGSRLESDKMSHFCGGALIGDRYVLTAAHCMKAVPSEKRLKIVGGTNNINDPSSPAFAVERIFKQNYNDVNKVNDLALLKLATTKRALSRMNKEETPFIPVQLCSESFEPQGRNCTVSGWGHMMAKGSHVPNKLREVAVTVLHNSICERMLEGYPWDHNTDTMICAGGEDKDACQGDSGGPLVCMQDNGQRCIAGVVSWGVGCATEGIPGVYTNVRKYNSWIRKCMEEKTHGRKRKLRRRNRHNFQ